MVLPAFLATMWSCGSTPPLVSTRELLPASGALSHGFSGILSVVELEDGRLLVSDARDNTLYVADVDADSVASISQRGEGPLQYANPGRLFRIHEDSTLQVDLAARRWLFLVRDRIVAQTSPDDPMVADGSMIFGADQFGRVARLVAPRLTPGGTTISPWDSLAIVLDSRRASSRDTVVRLRPTPPLPAERRYQPYFLGEQAYLGRDGWLVVVRLDPYRVEWRSPDGHWTVGAPIPVEIVPLDAAERRFHGTWTGADKLGSGWEKQFHWPEAVPPVAFQSDWLLGPEGDLLLSRQPHRSMPGILYDRIDRSGALIERITLEANRRIMALGKRWAYVVSTDADGLQYITRHPSP